MRISYSNIATAFLILTIAFCCTSCKWMKSKVAQKRASATLVFLKSMVSSMESNLDGSDSQSHALNGLRGAIANLEKDRDAATNRPSPIMAELSSVAFSKNAVSLKIVWLDQGFEATGFFVKTADGEEFVWQNSIHWQPVDVAGLKGHYFRQMGFPVEFDDKSTSAWEGVPELQSPLKIAVSRLENGAKLGLLTNQGRTTTVDIFVNPRLSK